MKFLVLALCVCAASAASFGDFGGFGQKPVVTPLSVAKAVVTAPVVAAQAAKNYLTKDAQAQVIHANSEINPTGYKYYYETDNGISAQSEGSLRTIGSGESLVQKGGYKYYMPNGDLFELSYTSDENGYQPVSAYLPVAPPVPEYILRSIAYTAAHQNSQPVKKF